MPEVKARLNYLAAFTLFLACNLCFLLVQFLLVWAQAQSFIRVIPLPWGVYWELLGAVCAHLGLYGVLSLLQAGLLLGMMRRDWHYFSNIQWAAIVWSLSVGAILCANAYYFPLSSFSKLLVPPLPWHLVQGLLIIFLALLTLLAFNALFYCKLAAVALGTWLLFFMYHENVPPSPMAKLPSQPNVLILGIDSLNTSFLTQRNMPFLHSHVHHSLQFTNTLSPLARTLPAWCSILTGLYAKHHHAFENLVPKDGINHQASLVWDLAQAGYYTVFASDDRRFNSMDKRFGFQQVIGPHLGVNDLVLGAFNDLPLGNLIINLPIGAWLFPYNHMNRASFFSYYPHTFTTKVQKELLRIQAQGKPIFLALHLTLPHWPYAWAATPAHYFPNEFDTTYRNLLYKNALQAVDAQLKSIFYFLKHHGFLYNSLLITLSDHGETLYDPNSRLTTYSNYQGKLPSPLATYFKAKTSTALDKSAGHGSDILSPAQYHSLLAFRLYAQGKRLTPSARIARRIALVDIAPTILEFMHATKHHAMDGISLLPSLLQAKIPPKRSFFIESGMYPNQSISKKKAQHLGATLYQVNPLNRELEIKPQAVPRIMANKLYGIVQGPWIVALYPNNKAYIPVVQNLRTGFWVDDFNTPFAKATPARQMLTDLCQFYGLTVRNPCYNAPL